MIKRVIQSAFALSLIFTATAAFSQTEGIDDFLGLEKEIVPALEGDQKFTPTEFYDKKDWNVTEADALVDKEPLKGQGYSIIPWKGIDPVKFLDIETWLVERNYKDQVKDWKIRLRDSRHSEIVGKVLKCTGSCLNYRGIDPVSVQHLSRIKEGDEVQTEKDSTLWIYLMDGTLVRLGAESSLSFQEINFSGSEVLHVARLNHGHVFWHPRPVTPLAVDLSPETITDGLPLLVREANLQYFERQRYQKQTSQEHLAEIMDLDEGAIRDQVKKINELRKKHDSKMVLKQKVMLIAPNMTIMATNTGFDLVHVSGGKSFFKKREEGSDPEFSVLLRGYTNTEENKLSEEGWHEVLRDGRRLVLMDEVPGDLQVMELLTKRMRTMELARELWLEKYTFPILSVLNEPKLLAVEQGYKLWGPELQRRLSFLKEYTRRIETTNLQAKENLFAKLEAAGEKQSTSLTSAPYQAALNRYLLGLKERYNGKKMQVREMNDLQYYVWILKNGKL